MSPQFLIDANLPVALARAIEAAGYRALHVADLNAASKDDLDIWALAGARSMVVVSKDADFADLAILSTSDQSFVWLRTGNTRKEALVSRVMTVLADIVAALEAGERVIEVR